MRASLFGVALGVGLAGCTIVDPPPKISAATAFPVDKGGADLKRAYAGMKTLFAQRNPEWEVTRVSGDQSAWGVDRGPTGLPLRREARVFVGMKGRDGEGRCQIVVTSFGEENQGGPSWGDPYISEYGVRLNPTSLHKAGDFENPFPIACSLVK